MKPAETKSMDIHLAKGKRIQRVAEAMLRRIGMSGAIKFAGSIAHEVARDSRLELARRVKKAKRHAKNLDLFNDG